MRAARHGRLGENGLGFVELAADQRAHQQAGLARGPAHPAVMAHAHEARGQDVGEPAFEEIIDAQGDDVRAVAAALVAEQPDVAGLVIADEALRAEGGAEDISRQIAQGGLAAAGVADVGDPLAAKHLRMLF